MPPERTKRTAAAANPAADRRKAAAARARQKAQESQARHAGFDYLKWTGKKLAAKDRANTLLSAIPYIVKEKHHPDGIDQGELWYKRPYLVHRNIGAGEFGRTVVCPRSFHPRAQCSVCDDVEALRKAVRERRKSLTEDDYKKELDAASSCRAKSRDLMLVYSHDEKEVFLIDEAHGGGNMVGFGMLLDSRITNPLAEEWAAFWLDGKDGMALSITWAGSGRGGQMDWIKPISIDFVPRDKAPVPDWVWEKAVELSELLVKVTDNDLWAMYQELPPEDTEGEQAGQPTGEEESGPEPARDADEDEEDGDGDEPEFDLNSMDRSALKALIKERDIPVKVVKSMSDDDIRAAIEDAMKDDGDEDDEDEEDDTPTPPPEPKKEERNRPSRTRTTGKSIPACPGGGTFGKDFNELDGCKECPDAAYDACAAAANA